MTTSHTRRKKNRRTNEERQAEVKELRARLETFEGETDEATIAMILASHDGYSDRNAMLIAMQDPAATDVEGFTKWKARGRVVMARERWPEGACSIRILAPAGTGRKGEPQPEPGKGPQPGEMSSADLKERRFFKLATVFDYRCTEPLAEAEARWAADRAERAAARELTDGS